MSRDPIEVPAEFSSGTCFSEEELRNWFKSCGSGVKVFRGCRVFPPGQVDLGEGCQIDEGVFIAAGEGVKLGAYVHLAFGCSISGGGRVVIGDYAGIGAGVRLISGSENPRGAGLTNPTVPAAFRSVDRGFVEIGPHALLFTNVLVYPNVVIGEGAVVSGGAVVHRNLDAWTIYGGNPLVAIGRRKATEILAVRRRFESSREG